MNGLDKILKQENYVPAEIQTDAVFWHLLILQSRSTTFLANRTNGRAYAVSVVCCLSVTYVLWLSVRPRAKVTNDSL